MFVNKSVRKLVRRVLDKKDNSVKAIVFYAFLDATSIFFTNESRG